MSLKQRSDALPPSDRSQDQQVPSLFGPTALERWIETVFDASPLGIVRTDLNFRITYANDKANEILACVSCAGRHVFDFVPDQKARDLLSEKLANRQRGISEEYETEVVRQSDQRPVPVKVAAMPALDVQGNIVGILSIVRTLEVERASQTIEKFVQSSCTADALLRALSDQIKKIIPADACSVSIYSEDLEHARMLFTDSPELANLPSPRWFPISPLMRVWVQNTRTVVVPNPVEFIERMDLPPALAKQALENVRRAGWTSFMRLPLVREGRVIGSFVLSSKRLQAYNDEHKRVLESLPIDTALATALHYEEREELEFRLSLLRDILRCTSNADIFSLLAERLAVHYEWETVAVYQVKEEEQRFVLLTQKSASNKVALPLDQEHAITGGILSHVWRTGREITISDLKTDPAFKQCLPTNPSTVSVLCMPITVGAAVYALLNIEDSQASAFAAEEASSLRLILSEVESVLERFRTDQLIVATYDATPTAVWVIDSSGRVKKANPAAQALIGISEQEMLGMAFPTLFESSELGEAMIKAHDAVNREVSLVNRKTKTAINVLLGGGRLGKEFSGERVITARDLQGHKRVEEIDLLGQLFYEIATQVKTPLALTYAWLQRLKTNVDTSAQETLEKALRELQKVEITYNRLALFNSTKEVAPYHPILLDPGRLVRATVNEFPKTDCDNIACDIAENAELMVSGDPFQLSFVLKSIFAYLLRFSTGPAQLRVAMSADGTVVTIRVSGPHAQIADGERIRRRSDEVLHRTLSEMALGEPVIKKFVANHNGKYHAPEITANSMRFRIDLPLATRG